MNIFICCQILISRYIEIFDIDQHNTIRYIEIETIYRDIRYIDPSLRYVGIPFRRPRYRGLVMWPTNGWLTYRDQLHLDILMSEILSLLIMSRVSTINRRFLYGHLPATFLTSDLCYCARHAFLKCRPVISLTIIRRVKHDGSMGKCYGYALGLK